MTTESIKYPIEVIDKFSKPLADFQRRLESIRAPRNLVDSGAHLENLQKGVRLASTAISNGLTAAFSGAGVASLGLAGAVGVAVKAVREFAGSTAELRALSRETGFSANAIRALENAAPSFEIAEGAVRPALRRFAENVYDIKRGFGSVNAELLKIQPDFIKAIRGAAPDRQIDIALDLLARTKNPQTAARIAEQMFGTDQIARFGAQGVAKLRAVMRAIYERTGPLTDDDMLKGIAFDAAVKKMTASMIGLKQTVAIEVAPHITALVEQLDRFIVQNNGEVGAKLSGAIQGVADGARAFNNAVEGSVGWGNLVKGIIAVKLLDTAVSLGAIAVALRDVTLAAKALPLLALGNVAALVGAGYATVQGFRLGARADTGPLSIKRMELERQRFVLENLITNASDPKRRAELEAKRDAVVKQIDSLSRQIEQLTAAGAEQGIKDFVSKHPASSEAGGIGATPGSGGGGSTGAAGRAAGGTPGGAGGGRTPGGANYMGGPLPGRGSMTNIDLPHGQRVTVNRESAAAFKGFLTDLQAAGAPLGAIGGYSERRIAGSGRWSQHAYGNAVDIGSQTGRDVVSPKFRAWIAANREKWDAALRRWNMIDGGKWRRPDLGHVEWAGPRGAAFRAAQNAGVLEPMPASGPEQPGSVDILMRGGLTPIEKTRNEQPLFRRLKFDLGSSQAPAMEVDGK